VRESHGGASEEEEEGNLGQHSDRDGVGGGRKVETDRNQAVVVGPPRRVSTGGAGGRERAIPRVIWSDSQSQLLDPHVITFHIFFNKISS
jgi:hypothetical protein